jgi:hypothetical protein
MAEEVAEEVEVLVCDELSELDEGELSLFDEYDGILLTVNHSEILGGNSAKVWKFYHKLTNIYDIKKRKSNTGATKTYTHLCTLSLSDINTKAKKIHGNLDYCFKNPTHASHAGEHITKMHKDDPKTVEGIANNHKKFDEKVTTSLSQASTITNTSNLDISFNNASTNNVRLIVFKWIVYEHIPFNTLQSEYFKQMFTCTQPSFAPMKCKTFYKFLEREFYIFVSCVLVIKFIWSTYYLCLSLYMGNNHQ